MLNNRVYHQDSTLLYSIFFVKSARVIQIQVSLDGSSAIYCELLSVVLECELLQRRSGTDYFLLTRLDRRVACRILSRYVPLIAPEEQKSI
jgi:hypothetical protein